MRINSMRTKIILLLIISSLIVGCIDIPKSISSNDIISETVSSITDKLIGDYGETLTKEQADYWVENSINNKYVRWSGTVSDVRDGVVYVSIAYKFPSGSSGGVKTYVDNGANVKLYDIRKDEILKINKNDNIKFTGKINIRKDYTPLNGYYESWIMMLNGGIELP